MQVPTTFTRELFLREARRVLARLRPCLNLEAARRELYLMVTGLQFDASRGQPEEPPAHIVIMRDCARVLRSLTAERSDVLAGFSVTRAMWDLARERARPDLEPGFYAELTQLVRGIEDRVDPALIEETTLPPGLAGREAALARTEELDRLWEGAAPLMLRYEDGLGEDARARRAVRRAQVLAALGGAEDDWDDWRWQTAHVLTDPEQLARAVALRPEELAAARAARAARLPFGVTPYYASLLDNDPEAARDRSLRAQVLPPADYVAEMAAGRSRREQACDFMLERDTSPIDLVTRRYPNIAILKPFNTCPQICVYCQRNWEIDQAMAPGALAPWEQIDEACRWLQQHPAVHEVLVTGGDPLALDDAQLGRVLARVAAIPQIDLLRVGSRTLVTMPMRVTEALADMLGGLRVLGRREVCVVTHVQHPYEITPELATACDRLRRRGVAVYNQLVYTFFVSRRFEAARLRQLLRRVGIDPYYTFVPKGKQETRAYRLPLARLLQEQKEEARLLPGLRRADEAVYNVPGLGKNYLRAYQHRDLISVRPDGARVYEFHPWEKNIVRREGYVGEDVPIIEYLERLRAIGEDPAAYASIWYYF